MADSGLVVFDLGSRLVYDDRWGRVGDEGGWSLFIGKRVKGSKGTKRRRYIK